MRRHSPLPLSISAPECPHLLPNGQKPKASVDSVSAFSLSPKVLANIISTRPAFFLSALCLLLDSLISKLFRTERRAMGDCKQIETSASQVIPLPPGVPLPPTPHRQTAPVPPVFTGAILGGWRVESFLKLQAHCLGRPLETRQHYPETGCMKAVRRRRG